MSKSNIKPVALALCTAVGGLSLSVPAFAMHELASGYMAGATAAIDNEAGPKDHEGKCGMDKVDADKDGKVSRSEFDAVHPASAGRFAAMDANGDGVIDAGEHEAHHGADATGKTGMKAGEGKCGEGKCGGSA